MKLSSSFMTMNSDLVTYLLHYLLWAILIAQSCSQNASAQTCDPGWFGSSCQYKCRCGGRTCGQSGVCSDGVCEKGWFGSQCQYKYHCGGRSCGQSGVCSDGVCEKGWFGSQCQYKYHCGGRSCGQSGVCSDGVCEKGWFGPACQFVDVVYTKTTTATPWWLYDSNAATCNRDYSGKQITVNMTAEFPFTWLRLQVNDPSSLHEFQVTFTESGKQNTVECRNTKNATVNETTLDIHCDLEVLVQGVILKGNGVKSLCSLYVSGGRNVALRQSTSQSSTYSNVRDGYGLDFSVAENAVDGNTDSEWIHKSCTTTDVGDLSPTWTVILSLAHMINKYVVYNRNMDVERIKGFTLTSFTRDLKILFNYTDTEHSNPSVYTIINLRQTMPVAVVKIIANSTVDEPILSMCEVELYGDSACPPSKYGRKCEHTCNCAVKDESCFVSTGGCPSGCATGFHGEGCAMVCDFGKYGLDCSSNCSQFCVATNSSRSPCLPTDGACVLGCVSDYQTPKCEHTLVFVTGDDSIPVAAVVGPLVAFVILVVVIVLGVLLWRRRTTSCNQLTTVVIDDADVDSVRYEQFKRKELEPTNS